MKAAVLGFGATRDHLSNFQFSLFKYIYGLCVLLLIKVIFCRFLSLTTTKKATFANSLGCLCRFQLSGSELVHLEPRRNLRLLWSPAAHLWNVLPTLSNLLN